MRNDKKFGLCVYFFQVKDDSFFEKKSENNTYLVPVDKPIGWNISKGNSYNFSKYKIQLLQEPSQIIIKIKNKT